MKWEYAELLIQKRIKLRGIIPTNERPHPPFQREYKLTIRFSGSGDNLQVADDSVLQEESEDTTLSDAALSLMNELIMAALDKVGNESWEVYDIDVERAFYRYGGMDDYDSRSDWITRTYMLKRPKQE